VPDKPEQRFKIETHFKQDRLTQMLMIGTLLIGMIASVVVLASIAFFKKPPPIYLDLTPDEQITQDVPLEKPNLPANVMLNWVNDVISNTLSFNFKNVQRVLDNARPAYTSTGYAQLTAYLKDKNILRDLQQQKWVFNCFATSAPQIQDERVIDGRYIWTVLIPVRLQLDNVDRNINQEWQITLSIVRVPTLVAPMGFQIDGFSVNNLSTQISTGAPTEGGGPFPSNILK
jgi:macrophage killing protein with similarity to conjugation protein